MAHIVTGKARRLAADGQRRWRFSCNVSLNNAIGRQQCSSRQMMDVVTYPVVRNTGATVNVLRDLAQANTCDLCYDRPEGPACIEVCPTEALGAEEYDDSTMPGAAEPPHRRAYNALWQNV
ncbi:hypothetical protein [Shewanella sp. YIC-542]|uniref:hypothetical protein n=1 Tax=Shewanella mytili TaxID=3377111 RepID=UPI00398E9399